MATVRIQLRRGTEQQWYDANPTLAPGEIGIETDTNTFKFGDGTTAWRDLSYALSDTVDDYIPLSLKGTANGVAELDGQGYVPAAQLPPLAKITVNAVADQAARLALTVEPGDIAIQADTGTTYVLESSPASTNANWKEISATAAISAAVSAHESDTTNVHGIPNTADLATKAYADDAVGDHNDLTAGVHGIADTADLVTLEGTQTLLNKTLTSPVINTPTGITKSDIGLANVDNTSDANKPISTAVQTALDSLSTQLDAAVAGITIKDSVRVAAESNITLSGTQTIDGISLSVGDRVLVTGQTDAKQNGVYVVASGSWSRATDFDESSEVKEGNFVFVQEGTENGSHGYVLISEGSGAGESIIFGTDSLNFTQFTGANLVLAGTGLTKTGDNTLNVDTSMIATVSYVGTAIDGLDPDFAAKANLDGGATFTGTIVLPTTTSIGDVSSQEISYLDGVTSSIQTQITNLTNTTASDISDLQTLKAPLESPTFTGTVVLPATTSIDNVSGTEISYLNGATSNIQQQIDAKAPSEGATFTGTISLPQTTSIGAVSDTEIQYLNGVTAGIQGQIDTKSPSANPTFTGTVVLPNTTSIGDVSDTEISYLNGVTSLIQNQIDTKASNTDLTNHNNDTTGVHGIADTAELETQTGAQAKADNALTAAEAYADSLATNYDSAGTASSAVSTHNSDTTSVHGISDTAQLAYLNAASQTFTGNMEVDGNMTVDGNLTVNGTTFNASATSITIEDNLVQLAHQNSANTVDLGLVVAYNDGSAKHSGIVRDVSADKWKLFKGVTTEPATTVDFTQGSLDDLQVKNFDAVAITATGAITASASGVVFTDGTQTKEGVPSRTTVDSKTADYTLVLTDRDKMIEINSSSSLTVSIPTDASVNFPIGTSIDLLRVGSGAVTIAAATPATTTLNYTPGNKLRAQWSSATLFKRAANTWVLMGDLTA